MTGLLDVSGSDLFEGDLRGRFAPDPALLERAHRRARVAQGMLVAYPALVLAATGWYALNPYYVGLAPDVVLGLAFVLTAVAFASWKVAAYGLVPALSGYPPDRSLAMAAGGYLIPIANFWIPYQMMAEIRESADAGALGAGLDAEGGRVPLPLWWGLWLAFNVSSTVIARLPLPTTEGGATAYQAFSLAVLALAVAASVAALLVVRQMDAGQQEVARRVAAEEARAAAEADVVQADQAG